MPATGRAKGTPASIIDSDPPQTDAGPARPEAPISAEEAAARPAPAIGIDDLVISSLSLDYENRTTSPPTVLPVESFDLEVQHYRYRTYIKKLLEKFGPLSQARWQDEDEQARVEQARVQETLQAAE